MTAPLETGDMLVVTVRVPTRDVAELTVSVDQGVVHVLGPDGFRHEVPLPAGADADRLHAALFQDVLELRAPRGDTVARPVARPVVVHPLS